ncbi:tryptophan transporter [Romboutsia ilealis]|uniref:tryptophan transporter n=1 Tax=Romboutsia ilealis TaxID=1115758 RepID=UPI0025743187|nr:tryptophan transporter [Romboutsia ilealis]
MKTNTKKLVLNSILLALGLILHQLTPAIGLPIQPDMALAMLFTIMILNKDDYKSCLVAGIVTGIFTALTTKFPGGQIPNVIDKVVTTNVVFLVIYVMDRFTIIRKLKGSKQNLITATIIFPIGTFISGIIFLLSAQVLVGLPGSFTTLFMISVLPAIFINLIAGIFLYKVVSLSLNRGHYSIQSNK